MGVVQLFSNKKPTIWPAGLSVGTPITLDASIREEHGLRFQITQFPVENGQVIADHVIELPEELTMEVVVTAHTDTIEPNLVATRHIRLYKQLKELARTKVPFDVVTSLAIYTNMLFSSVRAPRTVRETHALRILCQIRKLEVTTVDVDAAMAAVFEDIALGSQDLGAVASAAEAAA